MYAITGITGKVGGTLAHALLAAGEPVRAVVRDAAKGGPWAALGCEVAVAALEDAEALTQAFKGATAVFVLPPPVFDPEPGYPEAQSVIDSVVTAWKASRPAKFVCLSTVGADAAEENLLSQHTMIEAALSALPGAVTFLRPAWFLDNAVWDVASARETGLVHSPLAPTDRALPMVAARDVGRIAAELIQQDWTGTRIVELEGPARVSPDDLAAAFGAALGKPVRAVPVPRETWEALFRSQGMKNPQPRMRMLDGFNEGWIAFPDEKRTIKGTTRAAEVIASLVAGA
ncbi:NAD(P)H-binding protein [Mesorhizobium sp. BR1-1-9]|uniref:NmrA family NAD(P)-binding protein n=1 Tax=unclassified Mesorhizobium TaxID=325217 RepID=UPI001125B412|nr:MULTISPECIES: NAD(P)H-binding protein [unclassified Mesorhizobium]MBZ9808554.1 NAD(P)H-binding protein [Mesorhizobium sp. ESP-6-2]MBZ9871634.1 NAD(P)H-binding protein [Mesorhizobium sp. BR1-1-9]TPM33325.1 NmrA family transcriptional regulator [Mesorhizobium sp. B2-2-2]